MILIARYSIEEALRRRVFMIVVALTAAFLVLYGLGAMAVFNQIEGEQFGNVVEDTVVAGGTLTGLGSFFTLFLGVVLSVFMTMGAIQGDAERGVLQPLAVRPLGRRDLLLGRLLAAVSIAVLYVVVVYALIVLLTQLAGGWAPTHLIRPALGLAGAVTIVCCISMLGSTFLGSAATGIAVFMVFGAGLTGGLLGQIGEALNSDSLERIADVMSFVLPFEALYQGGIGQLTAGTTGFTEVAVNLGPFGGGQSVGPGMVAWCIAYTAALVGGALRAFSRLDI